MSIIIWWTEVRGKRNRQRQILSIQTVIRRRWTTGRREKPGVGMTGKTIPKREQETEIRE